MVRVRIGPSPTGDPHVGTAYIALFNYVFAKQQGGEFILRIEDTDRTRSKPAWEAMIIDALKWLGLTWDEGPDIGGPYGPYRQSERGEIYRQHAQILVDKGAAYPCFCTAERLETLRLQQRQRQVASGYDGHCRHLEPAVVQQKLAENVPHVIRLKIPKSGTLTFKDSLRGDLTFDPNQIDDQVLLKSDQMPTYHLANVVDDHLMQITHVIRAEEWITSTPKHVLLYQAFNWPEPTWIHMPLLRNQDKSKISKRKNPVSLNFYRDAGYLKEALLNYLAMMGWTMSNGQEKFTVKEMIQDFSFDRISLGGPIFDIQKLTWLNGLYLREKSPADFVAYLQQNLFKPETLAKIVPLVHERINKLEDFVDYTAFFFSGEVTYDAEALKALQPKGKTLKEVKEILQTILEYLDSEPCLEAKRLEEYIRNLLTLNPSWKLRDLFMLVRVGVTGKSATPPLFETMEALGKERCRRRLRQVLQILPNTPKES